MPVTWNIILGKLQESSRGKTTERHTWAATNKATRVELHMPFGENLKVSRASDAGGAAGLICPAGFGSCLGPIPSFCAPNFVNGNVFSVPLYVGYL